jgi:hypothetical protein
MEFVLGECVFHRPKVKEVGSSSKVDKMGGGGRLDPSVRRLDVMYVL